MLQLSSPTACLLLERNSEEVAIFVYIMQWWKIILKQFQLDTARTVCGPLIITKTHLQSCSPQKDWWYPMWVKFTCSVSYALLDLFLFLAIHKKHSKQQKHDWHVDTWIKSHSAQVTPKLIAKQNNHWTTTRDIPFRSRQHDNCMD